MNTNELRMHLEVIEEISRTPLYNSLEVGFRHNPLTTKEQLERYADACHVINMYAVNMMQLLKNT